MRTRRFPLISVMVVLALSGCVAILSYLDSAVPSNALKAMGESVGILQNALSRLGTSFAESDLFRDKDADSSPMPLLVNKSNPLPDDYLPQNLVNMRNYCDSNVVTIKGLEIDGNLEAVDQLMAMIRAGITAGIKPWQVSAGYRSIRTQRTLFNNQVAIYKNEGLSTSKANTATAKLVAPPGQSEHHTGLAFDITVPGQLFPGTRQAKWLAEHSWEYGFILRYPAGKEDITGFMAEAWHFRYVGQPHATIIHDNDWVLEEYLLILLAD